MIRICKPDGTPTDMVLWPQNIKDVPEEELIKLIDECTKELVRRKMEGRKLCTGCAFYNVQNNTCPRCKHHDKWEANNDHTRNV